MKSLFFRNSKGFSLVQVTVGLGLVSVLSLAVSTTMSESFKNLRRLENRISALDYQNYLRLTFRSDADCDSTLQALNGTNLGDIRQNTAALQQVIMDDPNNPGTPMPLVDASQVGQNQLKLPGTTLDITGLVLQQGRTGPNSYEIAVQLEAPRGGAVKPITIPVVLNDDNGDGVWNTNAGDGCSIAQNDSPCPNPGEVQVVDGAGNPACDTVENLIIQAEQRNFRRWQHVTSEVGGRNFRFNCTFCSGRCPVCPGFGGQPNNNPPAGTPCSISGDFCSCPINNRLANRAGAHIYQCR